MTQASLLAAQILLLLIVAGKVAGGTVAFQMSLNFYHLPLAIAAAPVARPLAESLGYGRGSGDGVCRPYQRAVGLALFLVIRPRSDTWRWRFPWQTSWQRVRGKCRREAMIAGSLSALAIGLVGETLFVIATQASYARGDARTPLIQWCSERCMRSVGPTGAHT